MKTRIRIAALITVVFMMTGFLSSCFIRDILFGSGKGDSSALGEPDRYGPVKEGPYYATGDKVVTLEWLMPDDETYSLDIKGKLFDDIEKRTGVRITAVPIISRNLSNQINLQLASNKFSDIIMGTTGLADNLLSAGEKGAFIPLDKLIPEYAPNISNKLSQTEYLDSVLWGTALNGRQYIIPQIRSDYGYKSHFTIRKDLLTKYKLNQPTTVDEFYSVLKRFQNEAQKQADAAGVKNKFYAFASTDTQRADLKLGYFFYMFDVANDFFVEDGVVKFGPMEDGFKEGLMFLNKLYNEGMMPKDIFSFSEAQYFELFYSGNIGIGLNTLSRIRMANEIFKSDGLPYEMELLKPITSKKGKRYSDVDAIYKAPIVITKSCKDPVAALRLIDWFFTPEGYLLATKGIGLQSGYGVTPSEDMPVQEVITDYKEVKARYPKWYADMQERVRLDIADGIKNADKKMDPATGELIGIFASMTLPNQQFDQRLSKTYGLFSKQAPASLSTDVNVFNLNDDPLKVLDETELATRYLQGAIDVMPDIRYSSIGTAPFRFYKLTKEEAKEVGSISGNLWTRADEYLAKFVTGQIGFDKWDEYIGVLKNARVERYIEILNIGYQRFMASTDNTDVPTGEEGQDNIEETVSAP